MKQNYLLVLGLALTLQIFSPQAFSQYQLGRRSHDASLRATSFSPESAELKTVEGKEQLILIQAISSSGRSFVIRLGRKHGISQHQKALFSTDKLSLLCRAIEVSHDFSLWEVVDKRAKIPFEKKQFVVFNTSLDTIWTRIPHLKQELQNAVEAIQKKPDAYWSARAAMTRGVYESVSETSAERSDSRSGVQFDVAYYNQLVEMVDWGAGLRMDRETASIKSPSLNIPTTRYFFFMNLLYNFPNFRGSGNHFYAVAGGGVGLSSTTVDETTSAGLAYIAPEFRLGLQTILSRKYTLLVEGAIESVAMQEKFADGTKQDTNIVNGKFSVGFKF